MGMLTNDCLDMSIHSICCYELGEDGAQPGQVEAMNRCGLSQDPLFFLLFISNKEAKTSFRRTVSHFGYQATVPLPMGPVIFFFLSLSFSLHPPSITTLFLQSAIIWPVLVCPGWGPVFGNMVSVLCECAMAVFKCGVDFVHGFEEILPSFGPVENMSVQHR